MLQPLLLDLLVTCAIPGMNIETLLKSLHVPLLATPGTRPVYDDGAEQCEQHVCTGVGASS